MDERIGSEVQLVRRHPSAFQLPAAVAFVDFRSVAASLLHNTASIIATSWDLALKSSAHELIMESPLATPELIPPGRGRTNSLATIHDLVKTSRCEGAIHGGRKWQNAFLR